MGINLHPSCHPWEGNLKFKHWSITCKPTRGSPGIKGQLGYNTKYYKTTSVSTSERNSLWRWGLCYFEATNIEIDIPQTKKGGKKWTPKYYGLYKVFLSIGNMGYRFELPLFSCVHSIFHVSYLKKVISDKIPI